MISYDQWKTTEPDPTEGLLEPDDEPPYPECSECGAELDPDSGYCLPSDRPTFPCKCDPNELGTGNNMAGRCLDCGILGELTGHMACQYPQDRS